MRVLCLWLPDWPVQRTRRDLFAAATIAAGRDDGSSPVPADRVQPPLVLHRPGRRGREVAACCRTSRTAGVRVGMPLAEVGLHAPGATEAEHDPDADRAALDDLAALFARRLSPRVGVADPGDGLEPCGLAADVTGCAHLFGGEEATARYASRLADGEWFVARVAVADGVGAAWGLARFGPERTAVLPADGGDDRLERLPAAALRLPAKPLATLRELGVGTVGEVRRLPRASLPSRFGPAVAERLDQFFGTTPEPVEPIRPPEPVAAVWEGEHHPVARDALARVCDELIADVLNRLSAERGVREAAFVFAAESDGEPRTVPLATARPTRDAARLASLLALKLDRLEVRPPRRVTLTVSAHERLRVARTTLFDGGDDGEPELDALIETLSGRLGPDRVRRAEPTGDPLPERSFRLVPAIVGGLKDYPKPAGWLAGTRPTVLLESPEPVRVLSLIPDGPPFRLTRRGRPAADVPAAWGPERIQTGWRTGPRVERDYWRAELADGERVWLFRDLKTGRWFLHGLFA